MRFEGEIYRSNCRYEYGKNGRKGPEGEAREMRWKK